MHVIYCSIIIIILKYSHGWRDGVFFVYDFLPPPGDLAANYYNIITSASSTIRLSVAVSVYFYIHIYMCTISKRNPLSLGADAARYVFPRLLIAIAKSCNRNNIFAPRFQPVSVAEKESVKKNVKHSYTFFYKPILYIFSPLVIKSFVEQYDSYSIILIFERRML